jgi:hypothetical protein
MKKILVAVLLIGPILSPALALAQFTPSGDHSPVTILYPYGFNSREIGCFEPNTKWRIDLNTDPTGYPEGIVGPEHNFAGTVPEYVPAGSDLINVPPGTYYIFTDCWRGDHWGLGDGGSWNNNIPITIIAPSTILPITMAADIGSQTSGLMYGFREPIILALALLIFFWFAGKVIALMRQSDEEDKKLYDRAHKAEKRTKELLGEK